jgi:16S rRNA processing protein RimM
MELIECGKLVNTHGVRGDIKVLPYADGPEDIVGLKVIYLGKARTPYKVNKSFIHQNCVIMHLEGVDTMESAMALKNMLVYMEKDLSKLKPGQFYIVDLIGLTVYDDITGEEYGQLTDVYTGIANDAYEILLKDGRKVLFPAIKDVVKETDIANKIMKITPLKGMFDI